MSAFGLCGAQVGSAGSYGASCREWHLHRHRPHCRCTCTGYRVRRAKRRLCGGDRGCMRAVQVSSQVSDSPKSRPRASTHLVDIVSTLTRRNESLSVQASSVLEVGSSIGVPSPKRGQRRQGLVFAERQTHNVICESNCRVLRLQLSKIDHFDSCSCSDRGRLLDLRLDTASCGGDRETPMLQGLLTRSHELWAPRGVVLAGSTFRIFAP